MRVLKKNLNIIFTNPNSNEEIVQAISKILAYNLAESNKRIKFDYSDFTNEKTQDSQKIKNKTKAIQKNE